MQLPVLIDRDDDAPPPPYTLQSALSPLDYFSGETTLSVRPFLRGGYIRPTLSSGGPDIASAAAYFDERPCAVPTPRDVLEHHITVPAGATRESLYFPHPERKYQDRDVRVADWYTFVNHLIPDQTECSAEKEEKKSDQERSGRVEAVGAEWNEGFFGPRGVYILHHLWPPEAPAYTSLVDLSQDGHSTNASLRPPPVSAGPSETAKPDGQARRCGPYHHPRRGPYSHHRRTSISSTSSTSSSSTTSCSIGSISSDDLAGSNFPQVIGNLLSLRHDPARKSDLKASIKQISKELRAQRGALPRHERKQWSREFRSELYAQKKAIKTEVKSLIKEAKATRKIERKARKTQRKVERESRRADRRARRCGRRDHRRREEEEDDKEIVATTAAVAAAAKATAAACSFEAKARTAASAMHAQEQAHEVQAWAYERDMRAADLTWEKNAAVRQLQAQTQAMTLERDARGARKV